MTKTELIDKVGKRFFFEDEYTLAAKLNYESGIQSFDSYLCGKTLKQIHAVIHLTKYPKGLVIKIVKNFSSFPFGLSYEDIKNTALYQNVGISKLIFTTGENGTIIFSFKSDFFSEVKQFFDDIRLKYTIETSNANKQAIIEAKNSKREQSIKQTNINSSPEFPETDNDINISELKQRHGCLTTWLILLVIANVGVAIFCMLSDNIETNLRALSAINAVIVVISVILLWNWKRIGFWIFAGLAVLGLIGGLLTEEYISAFQVFLPVAILWGVLQWKNDNNPSGWENMK